MPKSDAKIKQEPQYYEELERLSGFIKKTIESSQFNSVHDFCVAYGFNNSTLAGYLNCLKFPESKKLVELAKALRHASGEPISAATLFGLIDPVEGEIDGAEVGKEYKVNVSAEQYLNNYEALPVDGRIKIIPEIMRAIARDVEIATASRSKVAEILLREELRTRGVGLEALAKRSDIDLMLLEAIFTQSSLSEDITLIDIRKVAQTIRDKDGNYDNLAEFISLLGFQMSVKKLINQFMQRHGLRTAREIGDHLIAASKTKATKEKRSDIADAIQWMIENNKLIPQTHGCYEAIMSTLATELGFDGIEQMLEYLSNDRNGAHA